ncbi:MAG: hypothetical protein LBH03_02780 [Holophagales bacterium]|jgi:hypothetical protein|nr:hypothetical protein [Holophagales bacterium]
MGRKTILFALLVSVTSWAQEVNVYSTTFAQHYKQDIPGLDRSVYTPLTQFLGIDATGLGKENLSLHLFGWGNFDLADQSRLDGKAVGSISHGYMRYRFDQANGELQAGRFAINHGIGYGQIDGASGRVDLKGGFAISAFGGRSVRHKTQDAEQQHDYEYQRDIIFGTRFSYRLARIGELGFSFVQDGTSTSYYENNNSEMPNDHRRRLAGGDVYIVPIAGLMFTGRTVFDIADRDLNSYLRDDHDSRLAENDYSLAYKFNSSFSAKLNYVQRNLQPYFIGSNFPSLFSAIENDKHRSYSGSVTYSNSESYEVTADYRHIYRNTFGDSDRFGAELRWIKSAMKFIGGAGYHRVSTSGVNSFDPLKPSYSLSHHELRAWAMYDTEKYRASLDSIIHKFDDSDNPNLNGQSLLCELVASVGLKPAENLLISADMTYAATSVAKNEVRCLLRLDYKFGFTAKGGK